MANGDVLAEFDKCPNCGSDRRLLKELAQEAKEKGLVSEDFKPQPLVMATPPLRNPLKPPIIGMKYSNAIILFDVCLECGTLYAFRILRGLIEAFPASGQPVIPPGGP